MEISPEATSHNHRLEEIFVNSLVSKLADNSSVLDIGCGEFCRHSYYLAELGFNVDIVEVPNQIRKMDALQLIKNNIGVYSEIPDKKYEAVLLNYVLNILPTVEERSKMLDNCVDIADKYLMVSVRNLRFIDFFCKKAGKYNDGFILERDGLKTFNIGYSEEEITKLLKSKKLEILSYEKAPLDHRFICGKSS
ncbi:MAG: class I SAM-dependent methyltransferase [Nanoarchaeota archaeon]|nr:class I SAM-dependent methyltransferase [Nanoarchaeota archaeon]MBU4352756.1 class I SAM-dependent methyltransferase [Nanoarchaeota archaeon]MBU4456544.1 class I SAM-dependent methyltransferase [Nanoarchaeota archaeon]MCG2719261.1 class I SAM-dependent methyltransferase [Nanoarchaeota archaeon]